MKPKVTEAQIRTGLAQLACIMQSHPRGEKLWPLFERLERELADAIDRKSRLAAARDGKSSVLRERDVNLSKLSKTTLSRLARTAREEGVTIDVEADGHIIRFRPDTAPTGSDLDLDRELEEFETRHGNR